VRGNNEQLQQHAVSVIAERMKKKYYLVQLNAFLFNSLQHVQYTIKYKAAARNR